MKLNKTLLLLLILSICVTCLVACGTPTFTVQFDLDGGSLAGVDLTNGLTLKEGSTLDLSQYQPIKENHTFNGWKSGETSYSATDTVVVTADLQLTAQWIDDIAVALDEAKTTAKAALESYKDASNYRDAQKTELATAVANGKTAIDNATDLAGVETALANAKTVVDAIKTDAELTAEEAAQALANAKTTAKAALESYKDASNYRDAQKTELATAIANGKTAIDNATDLAGVETALANAKTVIDEIKTDAELTAEEAAQALANAKTTAKAALESYKDASNYRDAQKTEIATAIANGKTAIDNATDLAGVETALANAKTAVDAIKTDAELTAEETALALANAKTTAKATLDTYVDASAYRPAQQTELATAIANGKTAIDNATDVAGVETALANAKTAIDAIETDAQITAKEPTITTTITEGQVFTNTKATLDVWAKKASGEKLSKDNVSVTVNGTTMTVNWDDSTKTSYNFVFVEGANTVVITATDGTYTKTVTYNVTCNLQAATTVTVAIEGFTLGLGYIVAPYNLVLDEATLTAMATTYGFAGAAEMKANLTAAYVLDYVVKIHGLEMDYQGNLSAGGSFYMSALSGLDTSNIVVPEALRAKLEENGYSLDEYVSEEGTLGEFDVTYGAGWMYAVNGVFPNVGFCDHVPQDGDVIRVQFTLAYGSDIGDGGFWGDPYFENVNRDNLTKLIAQALNVDVDITDALKTISTFGVTQDQLDTACVALQALIDAKQQ
ncbi:MAG: InlB B-repeat-containing protein [Clostridia bacterium]|nr:InlB B-repeat-containing protein [Clostridia bacterium]